MRREKFGRILLLMVVLPMIAGMTGCKGEQEIAFRHLALNGRKAPGVVRIDNPAAFDNLWQGLFAPREQPAVDWDSEAVIGVFLGEKPTGGYSVIVRKVARIAADHVQVQVDVREPGPDDIVTMAITYPGHIVAVDRRYLPKAPNWRLTVVDANGDLLFDSAESGNQTNEAMP